MIRPCTQIGRNLLLIGKSSGPPSLLDNLSNNGWKRFLAGDLSWKHFTLIWPSWIRHVNWLCSMLNTLSQKKPDAFALRNAMSDSMIRNGPVMQGLFAKFVLHVTNPCLTMLWWTEQTYDITFIRGAGTGHHWTDHMYSS